MGRGSVSPVREKPTSLSLVRTSVSRVRETRRQTTKQPLMSHSAKVCKLYKLVCMKKFRPTSHVNYKESHYNFYTFSPEMWWSYWITPGIYRVAELARSVPGRDRMYMDNTSREGTADTGGHPRGIPGWTGQMWRLPSHEKIRYIIYII